MTAKFVAVLLGVASWAAPAFAGETLECKGLLLPVQQAKMASRAQGVIASISDDGKTVKAGEVVMELENAMEKLQVEQQKRVLELRVFEFNSSEALRKKNVVSETEGIEKRIGLEVAKVQLGQAEQLLERRKVYAPFDGVVSEQLREVGEAVDEFVPVLILADINSLHLEIFLPAPRIRDIKIGQDASVAVPDLPGKVFAGKVDKISPIVNAASGEFKVSILVPNLGRELVAGTYATAKIALP